MPREQASPHDAPPRRKPSIRTLMIGALTGVFLVMFAILFLVYYNSMRQMLQDREQDHMVSQAQLAEGVLRSSVSYLPSVTRDWSSWDFTYDYVQGNYPAFMQEYLTEYPFKLFRLNFLAVLNSDGEAVFERVYDFRKQAFVPEHADFGELYSALMPVVDASFREGEELDLSDTTQIGAPGFVSFGGQVYYLSSYPILHSDETGPSAGAFIFGRAIGEEELDFLAGQSGMEFCLLPLEAPQLDGATLAALRAGEPVVTRDGETATAYVTIDDVFGNPTLALAYAAPRTLYAEGIRVIREALAVMALASLAVLAVVMIVLNAILIKPLGLLVHDVNAVEMGSLAVREKASSRELSQLAGAINGMLGRIEKARETIDENNRELAYRAHYDELTGLRNRISVVGALSDVLAEAKQRGEGVGVFFVDVDRFKLVNDTLGHSAGDYIIEELAWRLRETFGADTLLARMGGDEFLLALAGTGPAEKRQQFALRILEQFEAPFAVRNREIAMTASVGSSGYPRDGRTAETLIKNAEIALYDAKDTGELHVAYHRALQEAMQRKILIEERLRESITSGFGAFSAYFQPKLNLATGHIESCEALLRWRTPEGDIGPVEFIPQAEESGLVVPLSWWMIRQCCEVGSQFCRQGVRCNIAVNISAQVLLHEDFLTTLLAACEEYHFDMRLLNIEIVEATLVEDIPKGNLVLDELHRLGAAISVDDFGTGYSSLSYLNKMAVDRIKIDRSFVARIEESAGDRAIIHAIIAMAKSLAMITTAEGVETVEQLAFLKDAGCDEVQGFLVAKPMQAEELAGFIRAWEAGHLRAAW